MDKQKNHPTQNVISFDLENSCLRDTEETFRFFLTHMTSHSVLAVLETRAHH